MDTGKILTMTALRIDMFSPIRDPKVIIAFWITIARKEISTLIQGKKELLTLTRTLSVILIQTIFLT